MKAALTFACINLKKLAWKMGENYSHPDSFVSLFQSLMSFEKMTKQDGLSFCLLKPSCLRSETGWNTAGFILL